MQTNKMTEVQVPGFVKEEGTWYADLPQYLEQGLGVKAEALRPKRPSFQHLNREAIQ